MTNVQRHAAALTFTVVVLVAAVMVQPEVKNVAGILLVGGALAAGYVLTLLVRIEVGASGEEHLAILKSIAADYGGFWSGAAFFLVLVITGKFP